MLLLLLRRLDERSFESFDFLEETVGVAEVRKQFSGSTGHAPGELPERRISVRAES